MKTENHSLQLKSLIGHTYGWKIWKSLPLFDSTTNFKWNPQIGTDDDDDLENRVSLCGRSKGQNLCVLYY